MQPRNKATNQGLRAAFELRRSLSLTMAEPVNVMEIASQLGIDIRFFDCPSMEGMYFKARRPRIFLPHSGHRPRGRILFSCAHELGHHQLGHGTSTDMYLADGNDRSQSAPEEVAADTFASHLLMPRQAVASSFARRGIDGRDPSPLECFVVGQELGVGYAALIAQLSGGLGVFSYETAQRLRKQKPADLRESIWKASRATDLVVVDSLFRGRICDVRLDDFVVLQRDAIHPGDLFEPVGTPHNVADSIVYRVIGKGSQSVIVDTKYTVEFRASMPGFVGTYLNSFLEEPDQ